ncbi:hypothetical protein A2865_03160 [Candidatus Woesebacteria bacterium RIFCSPHIGHO2_01_FULL_39_17]|uniref:Uncharacterized protein n=3 Tax=Candidatus Woeseibacteriota TaxID=1752722 RepID=A0A0G0NBL4_9BACT|nr:MAG: hypothetical protein US72_C0010G0009 [Microgenomates group bacterium GW2011_GWC1_38_12]KKQ94095.1 MAG: hypothetical protein UT19_C0004G0056 [Candidatus Woesebacteria bacterium GW2011_GWB1_39_10b]KKR13554.1 MAG: hypothetical protein UT40_C0014G0010 [Candidatus Woesebacteria bacterium GW2011_GWA1_39_21b]OGM22560.1 MAG: hypothetical protein A2865_03160 [Candidatus Woesebacteria bacterium RIFCSPHIGHO2_01_FULL_39_17]OGM63683.1 MAG: hypothetical protein A3A52_02575 [Candidatus Woesebacteria b
MKLSEHDNPGNDYRPVILSNKPPELTLRERMWKEMGLPGDPNNPATEETLDIYPRASTPADSTLEITNQADS